MTWFRVDDGFWRGPQVRRLGQDRALAVGVWLLAGNWAADNIDSNVADGWVPWEIVEQWDPKRRSARKLIGVGLWEAGEIDGEQGVLFVGWADSNPTRAGREADREAWRTKKSGQRNRPTVPRVSPGDTSETQRGTLDGTPSESLRGSPPSGPANVRYPSRPVPSRSGHLGGERPVADVRASERPLERCPQHAEQRAHGPCGPCGDARRAAEAWDAQAAEQRRSARNAIHDCRLCDGDGYRYEPGRRVVATPYIRCDHRPLAPSIHSPVHIEGQAHV